MIDMRVASVLVVTSYPPPMLILHAVSTPDDADAFRRARVDRAAALMMPALKTPGQRPDLPQGRTVVVATD